MTPLNFKLEIAGYRIIRRLGVGGMATVYLAIQQSLTRPVAIKVLASESEPDAGLARRFENEARTIARLDHPHIVSIFDVGRTSTGQIYYSMPFLANGDLSSRDLRNDQDRILAIIRALAEALGYAHDQGIVHRDVKPENVLFDKADRPMLADFGIALSETHFTRLTRDGATLGSSGYMSPEQARGQPLDGRADLYSLGVVCYELLTGDMPFQGSDALAVALAHIEKPVPRLPITRRAWQPLIDRTLAKQPEARFQDADELLASLDVIQKRIEYPSPRGFAAWWRAGAEQASAIPRRARVFLIAMILLAALGAMLALLPREARRAAMPNAPVAMSAPAVGNATSGDTPATATTPAIAADQSDASRVLAAPSTESSAAAQDDASNKEHLRQAIALIAQDHLVTPKGSSAADQYLAILAEDPHNHEALAGVAGILRKLGERAGQSIVATDTTASAEAMKQGRTLAEDAKLSAGPAFAAFIEPIHRAIENCRSREHDSFDPKAIVALRPLLPILESIDPADARALQADLDRPETLLSEGGTFQDVHGPAMTVVTLAMAKANHLDHAFAIAIDEVTRSEYARFVAETGREPSRCRASQNLFARSSGIGWTNPGFTQGANYPVVCVSWDDANAYSQWLSHRTGGAYRLPTLREWMLVADLGGPGTACAAANIGQRSGPAAGCNDGYAQTAPVGSFAPTPPGVHDIAGNVSEWIGGCANSVPDANDCRERLFRGLSWRDDDSQANMERADTSGGDVGYANVGFRVVRGLPSQSGIH